MVEMAVCFPVFMLILMGIIEFGRAMSVTQMLNSASRIGCRAQSWMAPATATSQVLSNQHVTSTIGCQESIVTSSTRGNLQPYWFCTLRRIAGIDRRHDQGSGFGSIR